MLVGLLIVVPLIASLLVFFTKGKASRNLALSLSVVEFLLSLVVFFQYKHNPDSNSNLNVELLPGLNR